jgi:chloramphenicol 3-O phosphotransferase
MPAQIIYLNGPSSAGKTTIARSLQARLPRPYLHIGIDHLIALMPPHLNDWAGTREAEGFSFHEVKEDGHTLRELRIGPYGRKIAEAYVQVVALLARLGHSLIVDDVAIRDGELAEWAPAFDGREVLLVGITASLEELERRGIARGDRSVGSARAQLKKIRFGAEYSLLLDTSRQTTEECTWLILDAAK